MGINLEQTAYIVCDTQAEYDAEVDFVEGRYGTGGVNEGLVNYTLEGLTGGKYKIKLERTIEEYHG